MSHQLHVKAAGGATSRWLHAGESATGSLLPAKDLRQYCGIQQVPGTCPNYDEI